MTTRSLKNTLTETYDIVCFCHLRWDFVFQRPQHLLTRFADNQRVFLIEEPIFGDDGPHLDVQRRGENLFVAVPHLLHGSDVDADMVRLVNQLVSVNEIDNFVAWYYTPMMLPWSRALEPAAVVYDCMDELSAFRGAPPELLEREKQLFEKADLVFTGGQSLYEAKKDRHPHVYAFPSSIDVKHFEQALSVDNEPEDQQNIPHPRIGFCGVIDERTDIELLSSIAELRPDWHYVMIGPVVKIDPADLPQRDNIHYLGGKQYSELPSYIGGWDVAMMPFAMNESTRYISPTKTPEYLAAGQPVVSTPIRDVVRPYGEMGLVHIASTPEEFVRAIEKAMSEDEDSRRAKATDFLATTSWDKTQQAMAELIEEVTTREHEMAAYQF
jgi:glycosyltransferase involved in cell wall biosynthesis